MRVASSAPSPHRGQARRDAILVAATELIAERGAAQLSMSAVARRAKASKETLYRHFGDRTGLLVAALERFAANALGTVPPGAPDESLEEGLQRMGRWYLELALRPEVLSFTRFVAGSAEESPALGRAFTTLVTDPMVGAVRELLSAYGSPGDAAALAEAYLGLLQGKLWNRALLEPELRPTAAAIEAQAMRGARLMARALGEG